MRRRSVELQEVAIRRLAVDDPAQRGLRLSCRLRGGEGFPQVGNDDPTQRGLESRVDRGQTTDDRGRIGSLVLRSAVGRHRSHLEADDPTQRGLRLGLTPVDGGGGCWLEADDPTQRGLPFDRLRASLHSGACAERGRGGGTDDPNERGLRRVLPHPLGWEVAIVGIDDPIQRGLRPYTAAATSVPVK